MEGLIERYPNMASVLELDYVFELLGPRSTLSRSALLLHALAERDFKLAKAHALLSATENRPLSYLFREIYKALDESEKAGKLTKEAKYLLAKITLYHLM